MSTTTNDDLRSSLSAALTGGGHDVHSVDVASAQAALGGPLLVIRLPFRAGAGMEVAVVAAERGQGDAAERLVQRLAQDVADELGPLVDGDASIEVADGLATVCGAFTAPVQAAVVRESGMVTGAVLCATDRRAGAAAPTTAAGASPRAGDAAHRHAPGSPALGAGSQAGLQLLRDVHLDVTVELGRADLTVSEVLELSVGSVVELDRAARAPVDVRVNGTLLARGEVVVVDDEYAVRITEIVDPSGADA